MKTYKDALEYGKQRLLECEIEDANLDAWLLLEYVSGYPEVGILYMRMKKSVRMI